MKGHDLAAVDDLAVREAPVAMAGAPVIDVLADDQTANAAACHHASVPTRCASGGAAFSLGQERSDIGAAAIERDGRLGEGPIWWAIQRDPSPYALAVTEHSARLPLVGARPGDIGGTEGDEAGPAPLGSSHTAAPTPKGTENECE